MQKNIPHLQDMGLCACARVPSRFTKTNLDSIMWAFTRARESPVRWMVGRLTPARWAFTRVREFQMLFDPFHFYGHYVGFHACA